MQDGRRMEKAGGNRAARISIQKREGPKVPSVCY